MTHKPKKLKQLAVIGLLIIILYSQSGYFFVYCCSRYQLKAEMKERMKRQLPDSLLDTISLADNQSSIRWEEEGREFSLHDQMYDVVRTTYRGGKTYLICLADEKEEQLVRQMCEASGPHNEGKNSNPGMIKIADDFTLPHNTLFIPSYTIIPRIYSTYVTRLPQRAMAIIAPPPQC